ncbi:MAG: hypothetical protein WCR83_01105 [Candidatus Methanomethylophilaceae archaeon]
MSAFKIAFTVPEEYSEKMMDAISETVTPFFPEYKRAYCITRVVSTWKPMEGAHPFKGRIGEIEIADELKIEFIIHEEDLKVVLRTIERMHPYEEPAIDVIPCLEWRSVL